VAKFGQSFLDFPPMQTPASFNLEAVKEQIMKAIAAKSGQ
jgi:arylsulfatase